MKKNRFQQTPAVAPKAEQEVPPAPVIPAPIEKAVVEPTLGIEEVASGFRQYRPHHLQSIMSFCQSRGFSPTGTRAQLLDVLRQFGW
jgi:hypothetical protein